MLIRHARRWPSPGGTAPQGALSTGLPPAGDRLTDVRVTGNRISEVAPGLGAASGGETVIDAEGCALLPGLHDHHIHLRALAAARSSIQAGPPRVRTADGLAAALKAADAAAPPGTWLRCAGYHESVAGHLDCYALDRLLPAQRPVRVQHRTGALWIINSAAVSALRLDDCDLPGVERDARGAPTGRLWRLDRWLAGRAPADPPNLAAVSAEAAALGVTGFTDATPGATQADVNAFADAVTDGTIVQRLRCMVPPDVSVPDVPGLSAGPVKILLDDDTLPTLDEFAGQIRRAHEADQPVAVHCVTRVQLILTLTALDEARRRGASRQGGDRIEHGAVIPAETIPSLRGLTVVTQPHFAAERGEQYATDVDADDLPDLWRLRSLLHAGLSVAAGSDAPFGGADPWRIAVAAARRPSFASLQTDAAESVSPATALSLFFGKPEAPATRRTIAPGHPADLVLLRVSPAEAWRRLDSGDADGLVAATFISGRRAWPAG